MSRETYYKVVHIDDNSDRVSFSEAARETSLKKVYRDDTGSKVVDEGIVFDTLANARSFVIIGFDRVEVWECRAKNFRYIRWIVYWSDLLSCQSKLYDYEDAMRAVDKKVSAPRGSGLANDIFLTKKMAMRGRDS